VKVCPKPLCMVHGQKKVNDIIALQLPIFRARSGVSKLSLRTSSTERHCCAHRGHGYAGCKRTGRNAPRPVAEAVSGARSKASSIRKPWDERGLPDEHL
jgi:hypothetical protein